MKIRSRSSNTWVYVLVGALVVLGSVLIFGGWILWRLNTEEQTQLVLTSEARRDRWFAISKFSKEYGLNVHSRAQLNAEKMPALSDTIILADVRSAVIDESISAGLENWVLRGGTLIYRVPVVYTDEDPLSALNSQYFPNKFMVFEEREPSIFDAWNLGFLQAPVKLPCSPSTQPIQFANGDTANLEKSSPIPPYLVTSESPFAEDIVSLSQMYFLKMNWGLGTVYFATDLDVWSNQRVDCADHAYVFLHMVGGTADPITSRTDEIAVWIVPRKPVNTPHLLNLVWDNYYIPLIGILITFLLVLIARNVRSSPAIHGIPTPRRATVDYVTSVTEFAWRKNDIKRFFRAFQWVSENPKGVFGPRKSADTGVTSELEKSGSLGTMNFSPKTDADLVDNVRKLQAKLRRNMQPSLKKS
ncbi:MAG: hypothetical protein F4X56_02020 [Gammaproteobacteria bacterium]|nr:hypothetical protein [Gammaproteobacteria bacterium]